MAHLDERFTLALQDLSDALDPKVLIGRLPVRSPPTATAT